MKNRLLYFFLIALALSCNCEEDEFVVIECPCIFQDDQPPYFKSCEHLGETRDRWSCMVEELLRHVYSEVNYPAVARENCIEGTVVVGIIINEFGEMLGTEILNDTLLGYGLENESRRAAELIKDQWCPGLSECEPVEKVFVLPIIYKLEK